MSTVSVLMEETGLMVVFSRAGIPDVTVNKIGASHEIWFRGNTSHKMMRSLLDLCNLGVKNSALKGSVSETEVFKEPWK